jgi:hypothetical protein
MASFLFHLSAGATLPLPYRGKIQFRNHSGVMPVGGTELRDDQVSNHMQELRL